MILVAYKKAEGAREQLKEAVRRAFPSTENLDYINEIASRSNDVSAIESFSALLLLSSLAERAGIGTESLILLRGKNGKPYLKGKEFFFSISHSRGTVAVALSDSCSVGIDIEATEMSEDRAKRMAMRFFDGKEEAISSKEDFMRLWVRTEAYVKLCGSTLSDVISGKIPQEARFYDFEIYGHPAAISYLEKSEIKVFTEL